MIKKIILLTLGLALISPLFAQKSMKWKKQAKLADEQFENGEFAKAAENYEEAWTKKRKKEELIFRAGESYYSIKDYRKAAEAYQHVKDKNEVFPLVGLKYARSLKQDGQYDKAATEFQRFSDNYTGQSKAILQDIIETEIQGCELGKNAPLQADRNMNLKILNANVNSDESEFAPFLYGNELYFSSSKGGTARIYSSQRQGMDWGTASTPSNFPIIQNGHFCNGSFSSDGSRFYFTICNADQKYNDLTSRCEIFVSKRTGNSWSQPERLPDYINMKGITATHPYAVSKDGQEILYFSSNRSGSRGGMDIWYVSRDLALDNNDFTFPVNVGPTINTLGDEISPYYDANAGTLFFSSNGQVSIGGFDIFKSTGDEVNWTVPENMGVPVNSSADDYFYIKNSDGRSGFLVSNRVFGGEKTSTRHADIFSFGGVTTSPATDSRRPMLEGNAFDQTTGDPLPSIEVYLYEIFNNGQENLMVNQSFTGGSYTFDLLPNRMFKVEVRSQGYQPRAYQFSTDDPTTSLYGQPVFLAKASGNDPNSFPPPNPNNTTTNPTNPGTITPTPGQLMDENTGVTYTSRGTSPNDNYEYTSNAPRYQGIYYKIQLVALRNFDPNHNSFQAVNSYGRLDGETITRRNLTRVLLGDFFTKSEAINTLNTVQQSGFPNAYLVQYENGVRYGKIRVD